MKFVVATGFYAGLGFAMRLQDEGHDVVLAFGTPDDRRRSDRYACVGNGLLFKRPLSDVMKERRKFRDWTFVWDENHSVDENELLRAEGFRVLGGGSHADTMEHDRQACIDLVERYGLHPPPSVPFTDVGDALRFLEAHPSKAYVYKPDRGETYETWLPQSAVPSEANQELRRHLGALRQSRSFLLQERKDGTETNIDVWFVRGEPRFAFMTLEVKRKLTGDLGDLCGCAFDFSFTVPLDCKAVRESVGRLTPLYRSMCYTGFADANFVVAPDGMWFLEKCERFGYNAHPNVFWNLNRAPLGETFTALLDGSFVPDFAPGFGAACSLYMDHPRGGEIVDCPDDRAADLYYMDVYREEGALLTAGYGETVLIANGYGKTIPDAWSACMGRAWDVRFPGRSFRVDGAAADYPSSPLRRHESLSALGYL